MPLEFLRGLTNALRIYWQDTEAQNTKLGGEKCAVDACVGFSAARRARSAAVWKLVETHVDVVVIAADCQIHAGWRCVKGSR